MTSTSFQYSQADHEGEWLNAEHTARQLTACAQAQSGADDGSDQSFWDGYEAQLRKLGYK